MKLFNSNFSAKETMLASKLIESGDIGFGPLSSKLEKLFKNKSGKQYNVSTSSASSAAFMIFEYLKSTHGPCDVYTPSIGFVSPAWAAQHLGHNIIFVDVDDNLLFDFDDYLYKRSNNSQNHSVVMPVLYGGVSQIPNLKLKGDETLVVDSAHCVTPKIKSDFTFFSFHPYKPICSSDGGMISTDCKKARDFFNCYRNFGRKNTKNSYDIVQSGFKFYMNDLNSCLAIESLKTHADRLKTRKHNFNLIKSRTAVFDDILFNSRLIDHDENSSYYFSTIIADDNNRNKIKKLYPTSTHYPLLHKTKYFNSKAKLKNSESIHKNIINLPLYKIEEPPIIEMWADSIMIN